MITLKGLFFNLLYTHFDPGVDPSFLGDTYFWKCEDALPVIQVSICLPNGHFKIFWNIVLSSNLNKIKLSPISQTGKLVVWKAHMSLWIYVWGLCCWDRSNLFFKETWKHKCLESNQSTFTTKCLIGYFLIVQRVLYCFCKTRFSKNIYNANTLV